MGVLLSTEYGLWHTILRRFRKHHVQEDRFNDITFTIEDVKINTVARHLNLSSQPINNESFLITLRAHQKPDNVEKLSLVGKKSVTCIPIQIGHFVNLETLILSNNQIEVVTWAIVYLKNLRVLDLSYNILTELPRTIGNVSKLEDLNVEGNHLKRLPTELLNLQFLRKLNLSKNFKLFPMKQASIAKDTKAIFKLLRMRLQRQDIWEGCTPWISTSVSDPVRTHQAVPSLHEICITCVLKNKLDFLSPKFIPPVLKTTLTEVEDKYKNMLNLAKCSNCSKHFSTKENFDKHLC